MNNTELILDLPKPSCFLAVGQAELVKVCAWCPDQVPFTTLLENVGITVSHGICPECANKMRVGEKLK